MSDIEEVKARLDIVDVVGQYVPLQKAGRTFKAPCPFHSEKTPSFVVSPDRQTWHCFGACGTGGDVISFVMKHDGLEFPEALRILAERAGVRLQERRVSEEQDRAKQRLFEANDAALVYFQKLLTTDAGKAALSYIERRAIDEATSRAFGLGFSLPGWDDCLNHLRGLRFTDREILTAGLAVQGDSGNLHDRFRNRLMFPVWDAKGRTIGFGARALDDSMPKYLNTAQTALFDKGGTLYALHKAQDAIRSEGRAVIVEGYMDVIAAHQHGFTNVVAQMGTALTERQVKILKKLTEQIVLALDADAAGTDAAVRGHDVVRDAAHEDGAVAVVGWRGLIGYQESNAVDLRVVVLPHGKDPDDFIRSEPEAWRSLIEEARPVLEFRLERAAASHDLTDPRGRSALVQEYMPLLTAVADPVVRAHYLQRLSRLAQVSEEELTALVVRQRGRPQTAPGRPKAPAPAPKRRTLDTREGFLLALLLQYPHLRSEAGDFSPDSLWETESRQIYGEWLQHPDIESIKSALEIELMDYLERLILWRLPVSSEKEASDALKDCIRRLNKRQLEAKQQATAAQIADLQETIGAHAISAAMLQNSVGSVSPELEERLQEDVQIGSELHRRERRDGHEAVEVAVDG